MARAEASSAGVRGEAGAACLSTGGFRLLELRTYVRMAHPAYLREKARSLRAHRRLTIDELAERLALPRTTIYYWVKDMPIPGSGPGTGFSTANQRKGTRAVKRKFRLLREAAYREGEESYGRLLLDPTFREFICLYIGEGYKRSRNVVSLGNSDTAMVVFVDRWLQRLSPRARDYRIQYHADQDLEELRAHWSQALSIDPARVLFQRKSNSGSLRGRSWRSRHGVLTVRVNDTLLRARMQAWMDKTRESWL
jgi:excisionase family DNA binding protein